MTIPQFDAWARFQMTALAGAVIFVLGGMVGLFAAWVGIAILPVAVPSIAARDAGWLMLLLACTIAAAIGMVVSSRALIARAWEEVAEAVKGKAKVEPITSWMQSSGLLLALSTLLAPFYTAILLSISSWMSIVVFGMLIASVRGAASGVEVVIAYRSLRRRIGYVPAVKQRHPCLSPIFTSLAAAALLFEAGEPIAAARRDAAAYTASVVDMLDGQIKQKVAELAEADRVAGQRISIERELLADEVQSQVSGRSSAGEVLRARARLLAAESDAMKAKTENRDAVERLRREKIDQEHKLRGLLSAAPSLAKP